MQHIDNSPQIEITKVIIPGSENNPEKVLRLKLIKGPLATKNPKKKPVNKRKAQIQIINLNNIDPEDSSDSQF
jgi:hypothetical protein